MDINVTLFGEILTFGVLLWVVTRYLWPRLTKSIEDRQKQINEGLEAAKRGQQNLKSVQKEIDLRLQEVRKQSEALLNQARQRCEIIIGEAREAAQQERDRILAKAAEDTKIEFHRVKEELEHQTSELALVMVEQLLREKIDINLNQKLIDQIMDGI